MDRTHEEDERRLLRPYRRFVMIVFGLLTVVMAVIILRGIIRTLDRLPTVDQLQSPEFVDTRALLACADDLGRLEERVRRRAGVLLTRGPEPGPPLETWRTDAESMEADRLRIVARCRLEEGTEDPAIRDLSAAARAIEDLMRTYGFLVERITQEGQPLSEDVQSKLQRALRTLRARR